MRTLRGIGVKFCELGCRIVVNAAHAKLFAEEEWIRINHLNQVDERSNSNIVAEEFTSHRLNFRNVQQLTYKERQINILKASSHKKTRTYGCT